MSRQVSQRVAVCVVYVAALFMNVMDISIVNVALPTMGRDLHVEATAVSAVSIGYLVSLAVVIPASGWLGDRYGTKRILLTAIVIFTAASGLCGVAQSLTQLVVFRVLQGVGGGMLTPVGLAMLFRVFRPHERVRVASILLIPVTCAPAIGPLLGGVLVTNLSWRWVFLVNLPIGLAALLFGVRFLAEQQTEPGSRFDLVGFLLSGAGFASVMYGISEGPQHGWSNTPVLGTLCLGTVLLVVLVAHQLRAPEPLLRFRLFRDRLFATANAVIMLSSAGFLGSLYLAALFFQDGLGLSALASGLSTFPEAPGVMLGGQLTSRVLYPRLGPKRCAAGGLTGVAIALAAMSAVDGRDRLWVAWIAMFFLGLFQGIAFTPVQAAGFARIAHADTGRASTLFNSLRQLGGALGVAVLTTSLTAIGVHAGGGHAALHPYRVTFLVAALLSLAGGLVALWFRDADAATTRSGPVPASPTEELAAAAP